MPYLTAMLLLLCLGLTSPLLLAEEEQPENGATGVPIVGYDDNSGWLFGGAAFLYSDKEPGINAGLFVVSNFNAFHSATLNVDQRGGGRWAYGLHVLAERAFEYYYGDGDLSSAEGERKLSLSRFELRPGVLYRVMPHTRVGVYADTRSRYEQGSPVFADVSEIGFGLQAQWDSRDKLINTRQGDFHQIRLFRRPGQGAFSQLELDLRRFKRLGPRWVLGQRGVAGMTLGQASYPFEYHLGGLDLLRGYKANRFRGGDFLVIQEELRWTLTRWVSINASVDLGAIRDEAFQQLKASVQLGLRIGLPPDAGQKLRADIGVGADQLTLQIQFGEIF